MHKILFMVMLCCGSLSLCAQADNPHYNKALADSLGADERGMKMYVLVIIKTGPKSDVSAAVRDSLMKGHMGFIGSMSDKGLLVMAGPLQKNEKEYRGIYIFNVKTVEEAKAMAGKDPSIQSGYFDVEMFGLYGSAALPMHVPYHSTIQKMKN
ncbi:MAG: YciI family protein [Chitinophagaceae bacterium]|jgi:uncharacterized protein YciI|nr:YciI family protein [Chitinophagaceae bacterium]